jgi:hypothetical protein
VKQRSSSSKEECVSEQPNDIFRQTSAPATAACRSWRIRDNVKLNNMVLAVRLALFVMCWQPLHGMTRDALINIMYYISHEYGNVLAY